LSYDGLRVPRMRALATVPWVLAHGMRPTPCASGNYPAAPDFGSPSRVNLARLRTRLRFGRNPGPARRPRGLPLGL